MRAHVLTKYGKSNAVLSWQEVAAAPLQPGQVRLTTEACALNPVDLKTREGEPRMLLPFSPPFVPGVDVAGKVAEVGPGVSGLKVGEPVFAYAGMDRMGAFAEAVVLDAERVARRPPGLTAVDGACLALAGLCALEALDEGGVGRGSRVLIHGGAGAVGSLAVQLAHQRGAEVFTTVSGADADRARQLGAAHAIDYRAQRFEDVARELDFVFDTVGKETLSRSWAVLKRGGVVASLHVPPPAPRLTGAGLRAPFILRALLPLVTRGAYGAAKKAGARLAPILTRAGARSLDTIAKAGLQVRVDTAFPLEQLGPALDHLASGKARGRVVLQRA